MKIKEDLMSSRTKNGNSRRKKGRRRQDKFGMPGYKKKNEKV